MQTYGKKSRLACFALSCVSSAILTGCANMSSRTPLDANLINEGFAGASQPLPQASTIPPPAASASLPERQQLLKGNGRFVGAVPLRSNVRKVDDVDNKVAFNFSSQPIVAVINTILGDMLHEDFSIAQGVTGEVSFSTAKPVEKSQALPILEMLLSWTNNALIRQDGRYLVVPAGKAVAGQLTPQLRIPSPGAGLSARIFTLQYVSATQMHKLLAPFARENAFLLEDPSRNILVMAGTPAELVNYQDTIDTFDVNWLKGMSIAVYGLERASVASLMPELDKLFGAHSNSPMAGMLRFLPVERTNAIVAISSQPEYLNEIGRWIQTIDQGGGYEPQMYVYDVRNMKATDLARYLRQIYTNEPVREQVAAQVAPGLRTTTLSGSKQLGSLSNGLPTSVSNNSALAPRVDDNPYSSEQESLENNIDGSVGSGSDRSNQIRITAQKSSNQLLVRCRPNQWQEIESAIRRLDNPPLQVQIETRILEVTLSKGMNLGVQWYLGKLAANSSASGVENLSGNQGALGYGGVGLGANDTLYYSFVSNNLQVALRALESSGMTRVLSAPSLVVMNNQSAQIQVGDNIPINQKTINIDNTAVTTNSVQYIQTGVILDVVPRINPGGLVYMDIQQQVSDASAAVDSNGNPSISTRAVSTQVAVQSGQTVLLGGLIKQSESDSRAQVPLLGNVPGLGWLFGNKQQNKARTELLVLITPRVVSNTDTAREVANDYRRQMLLLKPSAVE